MYLFLFLEHVLFEEGFDFELMALAKVELQRQKLSLEQRARPLREQFHARSVQRHEPTHGELILGLSVGVVSLYVAPHRAMTIRLACVWQQ